MRDCYSNSVNLHARKSFIAGRLLNRAGLAARLAQENGAAAVWVDLAAVAMQAKGRQMAEYQAS
jgi:hypothetical protein